MQTGTKWPRTDKDYREYEESRDALTLIGLPDENFALARHGGIAHVTPIRTRLARQVKSKVREVTRVCLQKGRIVIAAVGERRHQLDWLERNNRAARH